MLMRRVLCFWVLCILCSGSGRLLFDLAFARAFVVKEAGVGGECDPDEVAALIAFHSSLVKPPPLQLWMSNSSCCDWQGLRCGANSRVQNLELPNLNLSGSLPPSLGNLTDLRILNLSTNLFGGCIPQQLAALQRLTTLDFSNNSFSNQIPTANVSDNTLPGSSSFFTGWKSLEFLNLSFNQLTGSLPKGLCAQTSKIRVLDLTGNSFSGGIPPELANCSNLEIFEAGDNRLSGKIPQELAYLTNLKHLGLSDNSLSGALNISFTELRNLQLLHLERNSFEGSIPRELGLLQNLQEIWLEYNHLKGPIPSELANCSSLKVLSIRNNKLTGSLILDFSHLSSLMTLELSYNEFSGSIPRSLGQALQLQTLAIAANNFSGEIPQELGNLKNLVSLSISKNSLVGTIPQALQGCEKLVFLVITRNYFTQPLPQGITGFPNLQVLAAGNANLSGPIPQWLKNCAKLQVLDLSWNKFTGQIPQWIGGFQHLFYLDLSNNSLSGPIPSEISDLPSLQHEDNNTAGLQPLDNTLFVKHNQNSSALQYNQLSAFPASLLLSHNSLTGNIPLSLGQLKWLVALELRENRLSGMIPGSLADAKSLETLDLSYNNLSGSIPSSLVTLTFLASFNVSYNNLTGSVPTGNQFLIFTAMSYLGNSGLCGAPLSVSCRSSSNSSLSFPSSPPSLSATSHGRQGLMKHHQLSKSVIIGITVGVTLGFAGVLSMMLLWTLSRKRVVHQEDESSKDADSSQPFSEALSTTVDIFHNPNLKQLTVADLVKATNNFDQSNIIGCGGFGLVFQATLANGIRVAIKRLSGDGLQMEREFEAEVQTLGKAKHANLVTLQGYCRYGVDRLLVYSYMENGSLDYWLHERNDGGLKLDWPTRLKIAQGAGRGLCYLHDICKPHIVHRDIKSSNILLDEKFEAHVADFGLARLMMRSDTHVTTELVGTLGYIPPEYGQAWMATLRGDVFSFGVVILELLTRRRPVDVCKPNGALDLVAWVRKMKGEGKAEDTFDLILRGTGHEKEMLQVLDVACLCINQNPLKRPNIQQVVCWLEEVGSLVPNK